MPYFLYTSRSGDFHCNASRDGCTTKFLCHWQAGGSGDMATTAISPHAHACSAAVHCNRVLLVLCLAKTGACYLAAVASQSRKSIPGSALYDQCRFDNSGISTPSAATISPHAQAMYTNAL